MLRKVLKFQDLDGNEVEEEYYFNLNMAELTEMEVISEISLSDKLQQIIAVGDNKAIVSNFKDILRSAVGRRVDKRFVKNETIRQEFMDSEAYSTLFMELVTNADFAAEFVRGILPANMPKAPDSSVVQLPADVTKAEIEVAKTFESYTHKELLEMPQDDFDKLVPRDPRKMTKNQMLVSMQRITGAAKEE